MTTKQLKLSNLEIVNLYVGGATLTEIAHKAGVLSYGPIRRVLNNETVEIRRPHQKRSKEAKKLDLNFFAVIDSPEKAYWMGFIAADGNIKKDGYKVSLNSKDREVIEKFKTAIKSEHKISDYDIPDKRTGKIYKGHSIQICSKIFTEHLINQGITEHKSFNCYFPKIKENLIPHFIRGVFDGDGTICLVRGKQVRCSLIGTLDLLIFIVDYLNKNLKVNKTKLQLITTNEKAKQFKFHINSKKSIRNFLEFIYADAKPKIRLERKYQKFQTLNPYLDYVPKSVRYNRA